MDQHAHSGANVVLLDHCGCTVTSRQRVSPSTRFFHSAGWLSCIPFLNTPCWLLLEILLGFWLGWHWTYINLEKLFRWYWAPKPWKSIASFVFARMKKFLLVVLVLSILTLKWMWAATRGCPPLIYWEVLNVGSVCGIYYHITRIFRCQTTHGSLGGLAYYVTCPHFTLQPWPHLRYPTSGSTVCQRTREAREHSRSAQVSDTYTGEVRRFLQREHPFPSFLSLSHKN